MRLNRTVNCTIGARSWVKGASFPEIVRGSLCRSISLNAWSEKDKSYVRTTQTRRPVALPEMLMVNCATEGKDWLKFWREKYRIKEEEAAKAADDALPEKGEPGKSILKMCVFL